MQATCNYKFIMGPNVGRLCGQVAHHSGRCAFHRLCEHGKLMRNCGRGNCACVHGNTFRYCNKCRGVSDLLVTIQRNRRRRQDAYKRKRDELEADISTDVGVDIGADVSASADVSAEASADPSIPATTIPAGMNSMLGKIPTTRKRRRTRVEPHEVLVPVPIYAVAETPAETPPSPPPPVLHVPHSPFTTRYAGAAVKSLELPPGMAEFLRG